MYAIVVLGKALAGFQCNPLPFLLLLHLTKCHWKDHQINSIWPSTYLSTCPSAFSMSNVHQHVHRWDSAINMLDQPEVGDEALQVAPTPLPPSPHWMLAHLAGWPIQVGGTIIMSKLKLFTIHETHKWHLNDYNWRSQKQRTNRQGISK